MHFTDWLPTLYKLAGGDLDQLGDIDGIDQLPVIRFKQGRRGAFKKLVKVGILSQQGT